MIIKRIETVNTVWQFDLDRKVYIRIPKGESPVHPEGGKPYEGHEVKFDKIVLGAYDETDGMQQFFVYNSGVKWGEGACTQSWSVRGADWSWLEEE